MEKTEVFPEISKQTIKSRDNDFPFSDRYFPESSPTRGPNRRRHFREISLSLGGVPVRAWRDERKDEEGGQRPCREGGHPDFERSSFYSPESEPYLKVAHHFSWEEFLARLPPLFPPEFHRVIDRSAKTMLLPPFR